MKQFTSKLNTGLIVILIVLVLVVLGMIGYNNYKTNTIPDNSKISAVNTEQFSENTYIYKNHGFQIELPKSFIPSEETNARGNLTTIMLSSENMINYTNDASGWEANAKNNFVKQGQEKIGENTFDVYLNPSMNATLYWLKKGNEGYMFSGDKNLLKTFKLLGSDDQIYIYKNHGFQIELPKGFVPKEVEGEGGPALNISLPDANLSYVTNATWWEKNSINPAFRTGEQKIGDTTFQVYRFPDGFVSYWYRQGEVGYEFSGNTELLKTFKFIGWK